MRKFTIMLLVISLLLTSAATVTATEQGHAPEALSTVDRLKSDHAVAGQVYEHLHDLGRGDAPIAGVLGNMMAEAKAARLAQKEAST